jgi:hypothetical protein
VTTRYERMKMQRRMQRRIRLVVEERRMALARKPPAVDEPPSDAETTMEIRPLATLLPTPAPVRAVGRVTIPSV